MEYHLYILVLAMLLDMLVGDPDYIWQKVSHPVVLFGKAISIADEELNRVEDAVENRRLMGVIAIAALLALAAATGILIGVITSGFGVLGWIIEIAIVSVFLAQKSLADHVSRVLEPLRSGDLAGAKHALSMIVGRNPDKLDESGISRASIESLAENFSDGVVAPVFWYALLGLPGLFAYKMLNTADSMIGHMSEKYRDFGRASAKLDDIANWVPARISAILISIAALLDRNDTSGERAIKCALDDAQLHRSPNAGWPEAAMAGALDIALAGPRSYEDYQVEDAYLNASGRLQSGYIDIENAKSLFWCSCLLLAVFIGIFAIFS